MASFRRVLTLHTDAHEAVIDLTTQVAQVVAEATIASGIVCIFVAHATAAITVNENDDPNIGQDLLRALRTIVKTRDDWLHDRIDGNAAAHIKAAIVGPSVTIPIADGKMLLGRWQNIFLLELDGPRNERQIIVTVVG